MKELEDFDWMKERAEKELPIDGTEVYIQQQGRYSNDYDVVDTFNQPIYEIRGKKFINAAGASVGTINKKLIAVTPTYEISLANGQTAALKKKMGPFKEELNGTINGKDLLVKGNKKNTDVDILVDGYKIGSMREVTYGIEKDTYVILCVDESWKEMMIALAAVADKIWFEPEN